MALKWASQRAASLVQLTADLSAQDSAVCSVGQTARWSEQKRAARTAVPWVHCWERRTVAPSEDC